MPHSRRRERRKSLSCGSQKKKKYASLKASREKEVSQLALARHSLQLKRCRGEFLRPSNMGKRDMSKRDQVIRAKERCRGEFLARLQRNVLAHERQVGHLHKSSKVSNKRDLPRCQKRPTTVSKETYHSVKGDLPQCQKNPISALLRQHLMTRLSNNTNAFSRISKTPTR